MVADQADMATPESRRLTVGVILATVVALTLIGGALLLLVKADVGVEAVRSQVGPTPVTVFRPADLPSTASGPIVVIAHGFAGSQQLMRSFAITLARNGYLALTFDFLGHGRNLLPLGGDVTKVEGSTQLLLRQMREMVEYGLSVPGVDGGVTLLGHSMASDVIVRYAQSDERVDATIAVSMFSPAVTPTAPRNLLIIAGGLEGFLKDEAMRVVGMRTAEPVPGTTFGSFADGSARRAAFAQGVEHVGVLYSGDSMRETVDWLDQVYQRSASGHLDQRGGAIVLLLLGVALLGWPLSRLLPRVARRRGVTLGWRRLLPVMLIPAFATPLLLWWFPADFLSVLVGGYLAVHFGVYGVITAGCLWWAMRAAPVAQQDGDVGAAGLFKGIAATAFATAYVAGVIALVLDRFVTSFAITAPRLPLFGSMLVGTLAYFLAHEWSMRGNDTPRGSQIVSRACFLLSLALAVALSFEELFFLLIIAVMILLYFLLYGLFSAWIYRATGHPAVAGVANAVAFAWALAVVFPMMSG